MRVFITGIAGFIGFHAAKALRSQGYDVAGIDNFNAYYDPGLKRQRSQLLLSDQAQVYELDLNDPGLKALIESFQPTHILHLAAQAGVRYSLINPQAYVQANLSGFTAILEIIRAFPEIALVYASSSSVYGLNAELPYSIKDRTDQQASLYGVTKKTNELMAATYRHLFGIRAVGLRYFTVYGPWGRPDMAVFHFTRDILESKPIELYNAGNMQRDFTYIDDIIAGTLAALQYLGSTPLFNLGHHQPVSLMEFVSILEKILHKSAIRKLLPMQPGDVLATYADITESVQELSFKPKTSLHEGLTHFVKWYLEYAKGGT